MNARLLACSHADGLSIRNETDRIGLGVLERNPCDGEVANGRFGQIFFSCDDIGEIYGRDEAVMPMLFKKVQKTNELFNIMRKKHLKLLCILKFY